MKWQDDSNIPYRIELRSSENRFRDNVKQKELIFNMKYVNICFITELFYFYQGEIDIFLGETNQETENRTKVNNTRHASN